MQWLRLYNDVLDNPKVQRLPPDQFKHWVNLMCLANESEHRGRIPNNLCHIAFRLRIDEGECGRVLAALALAGLIDQEGDQLVPHDWDERQFQSDDVNARVKAHRDRNVTRNVTRNAHATLHVTPPDTDTDTDTEQSRSPLAPLRGPYTAEFEEFWTSYPRTNGAKLEAFKAWKLVPKEERSAALAGLGKWKASAHWRDGKIVFAERYLKRRMWDDDPVPAFGVNGNRSGEDREAIEEIKARVRSMSYQGPMEEIPRR